MSNQKNCSPGNIPCKGPSGATRCKTQCYNKISKTNSKQLNKLIDVINKVKETRLGKLAEDNLEDAVVNTAGTIGGIVGGSAGPVGSLVGDLLASTAVKHSLLVTDSYNDLANTVEFDKLSKWGKATAVIKRAQANDQKAKAIGEGTGFLIGNSAALGLNSIPRMGGIPLKGAAAAFILMPKIQKSINKNLGVE